MPNKNETSQTNKNSRQLKTEISYWKTQNEKRKCTNYSEMSYWEILSTNTAL